MVEIYDWFCELLFWGKLFPKNVPYQTLFFIFKNREFFTSEFLLVHLFSMRFCLFRIWFEVMANWIIKRYIFFQIKTSRQKIAIAIINFFQTEIRMIFKIFKNIFKIFHLSSGMDRKYISRCFPASIENVPPWTPSFIDFKSKYGLWVNFSGNSCLRRMRKDLYSSRNTQLLWLSCTRNR